MPPRQSATAQDKPFTFKSKTGAVIVIPSSEVYDPSMEAIAEMHSSLKDLQESEKSGGADEVGMAQMRVSLATLEVLKSGFSDSVAEKIRLKSSEVQELMTKYQEHTGVSIPK